MSSESTPKPLTRKRKSTASMKNTNICFSEFYSDFKFSEEWNWLPPQLIGERFESLKASIEASNGPQVPILVDSNLVILDGRSRFLACRDLELPVPYIQVDSSRDRLQVALDGALQREWTPLEQARFVHWVHHHHEELGISSTGMRQRDATANWLKERMGWRRCVSGKSVDHFLEAFELMQERETDDEAVAMAEDAASLNELRQVLSDPIPSGLTVTDSPRIKVLNRILTVFKDPTSVTLGAGEVDLLNRAIGILEQVKARATAA